MRFLFWLAARVPYEPLAAWLIDLASALDRRRELRAMPPPSDAEIAEWADGIVYAWPDRYFDPKSRTWRKGSAREPMA